jgi:hypothetical protein
VLIFRRIAATHVSAFQAQAQVNPRVSHLQTFFAAVGRRCHLPDFFQMSAFRHSAPFLQQD